MNIKSEFLIHKKKKLRIIIIIFLLLVIVSWISLFQGIANIKFFKIIYTLTKIPFLSEYGELSLAEKVILLDLRLTRIVMAILSGFGLAISGIVMQSITGNRMASPFTTGLSSAAAMGASIAIVFSIGDPTKINFRIISFSFIFSMISAILVYGISITQKMKKTTIILTGIALNYFFSASNAALQFIANEDKLAAIVNWSFGNLSGITWDKILIVFLIQLVSLPYLIKNIDAYNLISTGDESAISLGINVKRLRLITGIIVTLISASIVSFIGVIGFVGLVAPHITRLIIGDNYNYSIISSGILGALLMVCSDMIGRTLISPIIIPVGIVISFVGIPLFIYLIVTENRRA